LAIGLRTLIKNISKLYTADADKEYGTVKIVEQPTILVKNTLIEKIYTAEDVISDVDIDTIIDGQNTCILPGFVDAHTHPVFWKTRENEFIMRLQGKTYEEIAAAGGGIRNSARAFQQAPKDALKKVTMQRLRLFLEYGTTTIEAKSGYGLSTKDEVKALEIIAELNSVQSLEMIPTFLGAHEVPDEYRNKREVYINIVIEEMIPQIAERELARYCDVFCEKGVFNIEETKAILEAAKKYNLEPRIHADELHAFGAAELAAEMNAVTADHLVKISDRGINALAEAGVYPVLLPATTFFLQKDEYAPARKMIKRGCRVVLATDFNPGSSMTQNMQLVWTIAALKMMFQPGELLWATTLSAAQSLKKEEKIGSIEEGKQADLVFMDIPNLEYLPYHFGINHVVKTMKKGDIVYSRQLASKYTDDTD
jgi:imidazolonepropionase